MVKAILDDSQYTYRYFWDDGFINSKNLNLSSLDFQNNYVTINFPFCSKRKLKHKNDLRNHLLLVG